MTDKITLLNISSFQNDSTAVTQYNANNTAITTAINNTLSRDGTLPNQMGSNLDMNGFSILNVPTISSTGLPAIIRLAFSGINFNSANTDNLLSFTLPAGINRWRANQIFISNASASISTATAGVFTGAGGTGITIAANQAITITQSAANVNNNLMGLTLTNSTTEAYTSTSLFFRIGTAQGSPATADVILAINLLT